MLALPICHLSPCSSHLFSLYLLPLYSLVTVLEIISLPASHTWETISSSPCEREGF